MSRSLYTPCTFCYKNYAVLFKYEIYIKDDNNYNPICNRCLLLTKNITKVFNNIDEKRDYINEKIRQDNNKDTSNTELPKLFQGIYTKENNKEVLQQQMSNATLGQATSQSIDTPIYGIDDFLEDLKWNYYIRG